MICYFKHILLIYILFNKDYIFSEELMKATEAKLLEFIKKSPQFIIPIYQRTYSWGKKEC